MSDENQWETNYKKRITKVGSGLLASSILTGPAFPIVASIGASMLIARGLIGLVSKNSNEKREENYQKNNSYFPESPETAVARETPFEASKLLRQLSKEETTRCALNYTSNMVRDYLSEVPKERLVNSNGIEVSFAKKHRLFSNDDGFDIDIKLK